MDQQAEISSVSEDWAAARAASKVGSVKLGGVWLAGKTMTEYVKHDAR